LKIQRTIAAWNTEEASKEDSRKQSLFKNYISSLIMQGKISEAKDFALKVEARYKDNPNDMNDELKEAVEMAKNIATENRNSIEE